MVRRYSLALILLACVVALAVPTGCSSVFAQGTYQRVGRWRLDSLDEAQQTIIRTAIDSHPDAAQRSQALWTAAEQFETSGDFEAALVAYEEARLTAARPAEIVAQRIRRCRARLAVDHRWADEDLRAAGDMKQSSGLGLFREVAKTVHDNFVDKTPYADILLAGMDNLTAAMASDTFAEQFKLDASKRDAFVAALDQLRKDIAAEKDPSSFTARHYVRRACQENGRTVGLPDGVIISEFIFASAEHMDAYSGFLTREMYRALNDDLDGHLVGLGVEVRRDTGRLQIVTVFDGGPASKAGIKSDDVIVAVDGQNIANAGMDRVVRMLRGTQGSHVKVMIDRGGKDLSFDIVRDRFDVPSVRHVGRVGPEGDVGYLQITMFQKRTGAEVAQAIETLQSQGPKMTGLVIDLRNNPGGLLNAAVDVCSLLLREGKVVSTKGRGFGQSRTYRVSHWRYERHDVPLVVLVDGTSASASEIVAAAVKDHRRATLVGSRTFGKGIVQSVLPVELGQSAVYLTTARFYSPEGMCFHAVGIEPDIRVASNESRDRNLAADPQTDPVLARALAVLAGKAQAQSKVAVHPAAVPVTVTTR